MRAQDESVRLSVSGERRRREIGAMLAGREGDRRRGWRVLSGGGAVVVIAMIGVMAWPSRPERLGTSPEIARVLPRETGPEPVVVVTPSGAPPVVRRVAAMPVVRTVVNEPLPETSCDAAPAPTARPVVSVCILSDAQLLATLAASGRNCGLVRIGGTVRVVENGGSNVGE